MPNNYRNRNHTPPPYDYEAEERYISRHQTRRPEYVSKRDNDRHIYNPLIHDPNLIHINTTPDLRSTSGSYLNSLRAEKQPQTSLKEYVYMTLGTVALTGALIWGFKYGQEKLETYVENNPHCEIIGLDVVVCDDSQLPQQP